MNTFTNPEPPPLHVITKEYPQVGWKYWHGDNWYRIDPGDNLYRMANTYKHFAKPHDPLPVYEGQQTRLATDEDRKGPKPERYWMLEDDGTWLSGGGTSCWSRKITYAILDTPPAPDEVTFEVHVYGNRNGGWIACCEDLKSFAHETVEVTVKRIKK